MFYILNDIQKTEIREIVNTELLKRGFNVELSISEGKGNKLYIESTSFQTQPIMFKKLWINSSNGYFIKRKDIPSTYNGLAYILNITLNLRWESFGGGSNGTNLLSLEIYVSNDDVMLSKIYY